MARWFHKRYSKHKNIPLRVGDRTFHSHAEGHWYEYLLCRLLKNEIRDLVCQPRFELIVNGHLVATYVADFYYREVLEDGTTVHRIDDVKGGQLDDVFKLKIKLFKAIHHDKYEAFRIVWLRKCKRVSGDYYSCRVQQPTFTNRGLADKAGSGGGTQVFLVREGGRNWCLHCSRPPKATRP